MDIFIVWKSNISGWSKEIEQIFISENKAREYVKKLSEFPQFYFTIEKFKVN